LLLYYSSRVSSETSQTKLCASPHSWRTSAPGYLPRRVGFFETEDARH
jgi:hypothetical protein